MAAPGGEVSEEDEQEGADTDGDRSAAGFAVTSRESRAMSMRA